MAIMVSLNNPSNPRGATDGDSDTVTAKQEEKELGADAPIVRT